MAKKQVILISATLIMVLLIVVALLMFTGSLQSHMRRDVEKRLQDNVQPNIVSFDLQMQEQIKKVNTFAAFLGENWTQDRAIHESLLRAAVEQNGLLRCAIAYPDGSFITHDNKNEGNVTNDAFFIANMKGEFFITDPRPAVVDASKRVILFAAPIIDNNEQIVGGIIYSYLCDDMDKIFNLDSVGGALEMLVTKAGGEVLIGHSELDVAEDGLFDALRQRCTHAEHDAAQCLVLSGESGTQMITLKGEKGGVYLRYDKLAFKDWYMISSIAEDAANVGISYAISSQRTFTGVLVLVVGVYLGVLLIVWMLQRKLVDPATGALTLQAFKNKARKIFKKRKDEEYVVVKLDVKDFKLINRIHSFATGDKLIRSIAQALRFVLQSDERSTFARVSADVFVLLLPYQGAELLGEKRKTFIARFHELMDEGFSTKIIFPTGQYVLQSMDYPKPDMDDILEKVNFAHRAAKLRTDVIIDYVADIESAALFEKMVEDGMEGAIVNEEFTLYLQPKVCLKQEVICGAEALARWKIDGKYYMYPTDFIPVLERNGFVVQLDKYMFKCAARFIRSCMDQGVTPVPISVNFSRHHLNNMNFIAELCAIADEYAVPHHYLEIELTESTFLGGETVVALIEELHAADFHISMDDFGSGYSSFAQLKDLNIDVLKIDKGFFEYSVDENRARLVVEGILKIAQELNITTVAEGIEERAQVDMLRAMGCDIVQGYYFAKPMPASELDIANFVVRGAKKKSAATCAD